jgi:VWFA-related protein
MKSLQKIALLGAGILGLAGTVGLASSPARAQNPPTPSTTGPDGATTGSSAAGAQGNKPNAPTPNGQTPPANTPDTAAPAAATPPAATPGAPAARQGRQGTIVVTSTAVVVPVTVKDGRGRLVPDLHRDEFRVFEDNVEQKNFTFTAEAFPLSMVILVDNDLKRKDAEQVEASIKAVVAGMAATDEASLCRFDQFFHEGKGFTANQDKLLTEIQRTPVDDSRPDAAPPGGTFGPPSINGQAAPGVNPSDTYGSTQVIGGQNTKALDDAVFAAGKLLEERPRERRKIILLISDGRNGAKFNTNTYPNTVKELLRGNVSVFSVAVGSAYFDRKFSRLQEYSKATGGDIYYALKRGTMEELYSRVTEEARHQYTLTYTPYGTDRGADYHTIEVRVEREGLNVTAREGYYTSGLVKP